jgi:zinc/manganese transport system substrate-binding protein
VTRVLLLLTSAALALAGCSAAEDDARATAAPVQVVTATDVYADIARQIGGEDVEARSLVSSAGGTDPHSHETTARDVLAVKRADLVIVNGGDYDEFLTRALDAAGGDREVLTAVGVAHHEDEGAAAAASSPAPHDHGPDSNEHVWYDLKAMGALATVLAETLSALRPAGRDGFTARAQTFLAGVSDLMDRQASIRESHGGTPVAVTEPLPLYLLADCGLVDRTPAEFSEAIEEGTDVPVRVLRRTLDLVIDRTVALLVYNSQTTGPQTREVKDAAGGAGVPVVAMSETLPPGQTYLGWMRSNLDAVAAALAGGRR